MHGDSCAARKLGGLPFTDLRDKRSANKEAKAIVEDDGAVGSEAGHVVSHCGATQRQNKSQKKTCAMRHFSSAAVSPFDAARPVVRVSASYTGTNLDFDGFNKDGKKQLTVSAGAGDFAGPMQLLLFAMATCAMTDVVTILKKQKQTFSDLRCDVSAQRSETLTARPYEQVRLDFGVVAPGLSEDNFARTVALSLHKYCGVHATLLGGPATITHTATVHNKQ